MKKQVHRTIRDKEIEKQQCFICDNYFLEITIHHIDGNNKNNKKNNLLPCCKKCHLKIHKGLSKKDKQLNDEIKYNILDIRRRLLKTKNFSKQYINERLEYELFMATKGGTRYSQKNNCLICKTKDNLTRIIPNHIKRFCNEQQQLKYSIVVCKSCKKQIKPK